MVSPSYCGNNGLLTTTSKGPTSGSICSKLTLTQPLNYNIFHHFTLGSRVPFKLTFISDNWENTDGTNPIMSAGFKLNFEQLKC